MAVTALMTAISSAASPGLAAAGRHRQVPPASSIVALAALGIVNTGVAYWLFYLLMLVVALSLGVGLLGDRLTAGAIAGLIRIALGAWLATSRHTPGEVLASVGPRRTRRCGPASEGRRRGSSIRSWPRRMTSTRDPAGPGGTRAGLRRE